MRTIFTCIAGIFTAGQLLAQTTALDVCNSLALSSLTDTSSIVEQERVARSQFDLFCQETGSKRDSLAGKSSSFKSSFSRASSSLGLSAGSDRISSLSEEKINKVCDIGVDNFVSDYQYYVSSNIGSALASTVSDCVNNVAGFAGDFIYGTVELTEDGSYIIANITRRAPSTAPELKFVGLSPKPFFENCTNGFRDAQDLELKGEFVVSCKVKRPNLSVQKGTVVFASLDGNQGQVKFSATKPDYVKRSDLLAEIQQQLKGSVLAFHSEACPQGWREYVPAYGRFVRGIDRNSLNNLAQVDPEGTRFAGTIQEDAFEAHYHSVKRFGSALNNGRNDTNIHLGYAGRKLESVATTTSGGAAETRPDNVALLYCIRS